jgi:hypothetical protein
MLPRTIARTPRPVLALLFCVVIFVACSGKVNQAGGLEVVISVQNLQAGTDFDWLKIDVAQETNAAQGTWGTSHNLYDQAATQPAFFPTSVALLAGSSADQTVRVTVTALLGGMAGTVVVQSEAETTVPTDRVLELDMYLSRSCVNVPCDAGKSCVGGTCTAITQVTLVPYTQGAGNSGGTMSGSSGGTSSGSSGAPGADAGVPQQCPSGCAASGCCDPNNFTCVPSGSMCSNGGTCTGTGGTCSGTDTGCPASQSALVQSHCVQVGGCYNGGCNCTICAGGDVCSAGVCLPSSGTDAGIGGCDPTTCGAGCCDTGGCIGYMAVCPSGGTCKAQGGGPCTSSGPGTCSPSQCAATGGCCTGSGSCIPAGTQCPNGTTCTAASGGQCSTAGCGAPGSPCCPGAVCSSGVCSNGTCVAQVSCSTVQEPVSGTAPLTAILAGIPFGAKDGFVVMTGGTGSGPASAMFYFTSYANACGYAQSGDAQASGQLVTFGVSPTSGSGYSALVGSFPNGGMNLGAGIVTENPSGGGCSPTYRVGQCGSGSLIVHITQASATQVTGYLSGTCQGGDSMTTSGNFVLPVCGTPGFSPSGTSACCP